MPSSPMGRAQIKIVLLVAHTPRGEPQHRFVASQLATSCPNELAAIIWATGEPNSIYQRMRAITKRYSLRQIASKIVLKISHRLNQYGAKRERVLSNTLFSEW